eukprot:Awhi_evm1s6433
MFAFSVSPNYFDFDFNLILVPWLYFYSISLTIIFTLALDLTFTAILALHQSSALALALALAFTLALALAFTLALALAFTLALALAFTLALALHQSSVFTPNYFSNLTGFIPYIILTPTSPQTQTQIPHPTPRIYLLPSQ